MSELSREEAFKLLKIPEGANFYSIRHAYRKQLLRWHPKLHDHSSESIHKFIEIREAFKLLVGPAEDQDEDIWKAMVGSNTSIYRMKDGTGSGYFYFVDKDDQKSSNSSTRTKHVYPSNRSIMPKPLEELNEKPTDPDTLNEMEKKANKAAKELIDEENKAKRKAEKRKKKKVRQKKKKQKEKEATDENNEESECDEDISLDSYKDRHKGSRGAEKSPRQLSDETFLKLKSIVSTKKFANSVLPTDQSRASDTYVLNKPQTKMKNGIVSKHVSVDWSSSDGEKSDEPEWDENSAFFVKVANSAKLKVKTTKKQSKAECEVPVNILKSKNLAAIGSKKANQGDYAGAATCFTDAISLHNRERLYFSNRSFCYEKLGNYTRALDDANTVISLSPDWDKGYFRKGKILYQMKRFAEAETAFERAYKLDRSNKEAENELHACQLEQLLIMGFPKARCENALRKTGGVQLALDELLSGVLVDSSLQDVYISDEEDLALLEEEIKSSSGSHGEGSYLQDGDDHQSEDAYSEVEYNSLWVGNVTQSIKEEQMMQYFSQFGELTGVNMLYPSRCAFVNYRDPESAKLALLARDTIEVEDTTLIIRYPERAFRSAPKSSPRANAQAQRSVSSVQTGRECYYWRSTGCHFGPRCHYVHIPANKGIDLENIPGKR